MINPAADFSTLPAVCAILKRLGTGIFDQAQGRPQDPRSGRRCVAGFLRLRPLMRLLRQRLVFATCVAQETGANLFCPVAEPA
ncbi:hypothetical protein [Marinibacterium profundimaris]|uniref:hypothetical protein n=1 Tax=Marinibacterium profundimaris TaxID=1679460 RepID=UPI00118053DA|nr:hypothetical protein [Marinibacterium profundimaris]